MRRPGDADFEEFVHAAGPRLFRTALLLTGDRDRAEDLTQTAFTQAFARWRRVSAADHPVAYARTILLRAFLSDRRRPRVGEVAMAAVPDRASPGNPTADDAVALRRVLLDALGDLSPQDRAVLVLRFWEDQSVADTAAALGITEVACRTRTSRALQRMRTRIPDLEDTDEAL